MHVFRIVLSFILLSFHAFASFSLEEYLLSTYHSSIITTGAVNTDEPKLAPNIYLSLIQFDTYTNSFQKSSLCLNIKTKDKLDQGFLYLVQKKEAPCSESLLDEEVLWKKKYYNFSIKLNRSYFVMKIDDKTYKLSFINVKNKNHQRGSSHIAKNKYGSTMISINSVQNSHPEVTLSLKDGEICRLVDDNCKVIFDKCDQCDNSSYYFKNNTCRSKNSKICGIDLCGQRGEVACLRGHEATKMSQYCIQDSPVGFCHGDLRVACINGILICE